MTARTATPEVAGLRFDSGKFDELCAARNAANLAEKATLVGVDESTLWRIYNGQTPRFVTARRIASRLEVSTDDLWPVAA